MFLEAIVLGVILGYIRKGRLSNIGFSQIRGWFMIILAFLLQISPLFSTRFSTIKLYENYSYLISMIFILIVIMVNINKKGFKLFFIGVILNLIVVFMNGYKMPIHFEGLGLAGMENTIELIKTGQIINYMSLDNVTNWTKYLGKFIVIPKPYPLAKVISVGDIFMSLGIIMFIQGEMVKSYFAMKSRMIKMGYKTKI